METKIIIYYCIILICSRVLISFLYAINFIGVFDKNECVEGITTGWILLFIYLLFRWIIIPISIWWFTY